LEQEIKRIKAGNKKKSKERDKLGKKKSSKRENLSFYFIMKNYLID
jgi:hypothetical protein